MGMTKRITAGAAALLCAFAVAAGLGLASAQAAFADTTAIYTVPATSSYYNPVTGEVEDSAGESNTALGESMVEGVAYENALVEVDSDGNTWVTLRLRLADQLGDVAVEVDADGDGDFASTEATEMQTAVENEGEDTETQLIDYRYQIPSTSSYTRVSMYVEPMGRDVVFFLILDFESAVEGNTDAIPFVESVVAGEEIAAAEADEEEAAEEEAADDDATADEAADEAAEEEEEAAEEEAATEESSDGSMLPIVVVALIAVIVIALILWYFMAYKPKHSAQAQAAAAATGTAAAAAAAAASKRTHPALQKDDVAAKADAPSGDAASDETAPGKDA